MNGSFETNSNLEPIGQAKVTPLQEPDKPTVPPKNLRPHTLSNTVRRILSVTRLNVKQIDYMTITSVLDNVLEVHSSHQMKLNASNHA